MLCCASEGIGIKGSPMQGVYALVIELSGDLEIRIGSMGTRNFSAGNYVYIGSAQNGLDKRIKRHLGNKKTRYWHIDYLLTLDSAEVEEILYKQAPKKLECETAKNLIQYGTPVLGFGSSDCRCESHLVRISDWKIAGLLSEWLVYY